MSLLYFKAFAICTLLMSYWPSTLVSSSPTQTICSLHQNEYPIEFIDKSLKPFLEDFKASTAIYDVALIEIKGGQGLFYKRLCLNNNGIAYFYELGENAKLEIRKRPYSNRLSQLFEKIGSGHFSSIYQGYTSEPSTDILLVKKAGVIQFSYALDRGCFESLTKIDKGKVMDALPLVAYLKKL